MEPKDRKPRQEQDRPEQDRTDRSLRDERTRADTEFGKRRESIEEDADSVVDGARASADTTLRAARRRADERLTHSQAPPQERDIVARERAEEDAALAQERRTSDEKLQDEREQRHRALAALLHHEREATDEHLLLERARSDDALLARDDVLGMVSHDLRTLLGGIAMRTAMISRHLGEDDAGRRARKDAESIQRFTARMNRLVGDLLDVASIEAGALAVQPRPDDASRLVRDALEAFQPAAAARGLSLDAQLVRDPLLARFDHERILQVLANLLSNAIKFTPEGGRIALRVEPVGEEVRVTVTDSGPGIPPEDLERIFQRFWQVRAGDKRGLGLGLYISRCIVEAHGGKLWAESERGVGSTFSFTLPGARAS